jgi:hypothetical protein
MNRLIRTTLVAALGIGLIAAKHSRDEVGAPETVVPPCFVPAEAITGRWQTIHLMHLPLTLRLPPTFKPDSTDRFIHGGWIWKDGERQFDIGDGNWGERSFGMGSAACPGYSECVDTLGGVPFRIITTFNTNFQAYKLYAVPLVKPDNIMGYTPALTWSSPDSSDQRSFLTMLRTIEREPAEGAR